MKLKQKYLLINFVILLCLIVADWYYGHYLQWQTYTNPDYPKISIQYPKNWTYKEDFANGTHDLLVMFYDQHNVRSIDFHVSSMAFYDDNGPGIYTLLTNNAKRTVFQPIMIANQKGYTYDDLAPAEKARYYFPLPQGYYSISLLNQAHRSEFDQIIQTFTYK